MCNLNKFALELSLERQTISRENPVGHRVSRLSQMWGEIWSFDIKYCGSKCQTWSNCNSFGNTRSPSCYLCWICSMDFHRAKHSWRWQRTQGMEWALCARWADSQLLRGTEDLVKGRQWHLPQQKSWLQAVLLPLLKGQDDWASSFCGRNRAGGEQIACFSSTFHFPHLSNDLPLSQTGYCFVWDAIAYYLS